MIAARWPFDAGMIRARCQLSRGGERVEPKTPQACREVILMPALARLLRERKMASAWKAAVAEGRSTTRRADPWS